MSKRQIPIRLHRQHDMDLICLYRIKSFHLGRELKRSLVSYANESPYEVEMPQQDPEEGYVPTSSLLHIVLDDEKPEEAEAIKLLDDIKNGYRCSFIKSVFRGKAPYLPLIAFANGNGFVMKKDDTSATIRKMQRTAIKNKTVVDDSKKVSQKNVDVPEPVRPEPEPPIESVASETEQFNNNNTDQDDLSALFMQMSNLNH